MKAKKWISVVLCLSALTGCAPSVPNQSIVPPAQSSCAGSAVQPDELRPNPEQSLVPEQPSVSAPEPDPDLSHDLPRETTTDPEPIPEPLPEPKPDPEPEPEPDPGLSPDPEPPSQTQIPGYVEMTPVVEQPEQLEQEANVLADSVVTAAPIVLETSAPGTLEARNSRCVIDYSNSRDGYVMVNFTDSTQKRLKARVVGPTTAYTYNIEPGMWTVFPLSDGNGEYQITLNENVVDNKYAVVNSVKIAVELADEFAPFLRPNQYVDYAQAELALKKASELAGSVADPLEKVAAIYNFVIGALKYDKEKAAAVQSGYLPVLDEVLRSGKGICFDYAALMTGMLRCQSVPCRLVVGYAGNTYHAWIDVWSEQTGWVSGAVFFDGTAWHRMDPTFASSGNQSSSIMEYIGNGSNYTAKYLY